jgi:hypothetical protein
MPSKQWFRQEGHRSALKAAIVNSPLSPIQSIKHIHGVCGVSFFLVGLLHGIHHRVDKGIKRGNSKDTLQVTTGHGVVRIDKFVF